MFITNSKQKPVDYIFSGLIVVSVIAVYFASIDVQCAPTKSSGSDNNNAINSNGNRLLRSGILSGLFRRQTNSGSTSASESSSNDSDESQTQTEIDAQKFMDSLPNVKPTNSGPSSFRERVSDTFGLLRDGVNNHFRSIRENFSDTVEDLRDTWSNSE